MEALYKNDKHFHNRLRILENTTTVLTKVILIDLQALKTWIKRYDEGLDILYKNIQKFLTVTNDIFYRITKPLNSHHLAMKMLSKAFTEYKKPVEKTQNFITYRVEHVRTFLLHYMLYQMQESHTR